MTRSKQLWISLAVFVIVFLAGGSLLADILEVQGLAKTEALKKLSGQSREGFRSSVSQRNLLGLERTGKSLLPVRALASDHALTIQVCAIRVQFQYEEPDDPWTTGRGHFDFRTRAEFAAQERHEIDPAPHNRKYFEKHLEALNYYWNVVSGGKRAIAGTVFPAASDSVYTLSQPLSHYGSEEPQFGLADLFYDALTLADQDEDIIWENYDVFVVFHAGADRQNNLGFPPTDTDLYTGFLIMAQPVPMQNNTVLIWEGLIMPETVSQDNRATAMNAVMAHEFGHQLGLVDLYDTRTFTTRVGDFSLMDDNGFGTGVELGFELTNSVLGTIPVFPDAWSRAYLGFVDVVELEAGINFPVLAAELARDQNKVYKIPISENEYYLVENRQVDPDRDGGANLKADLDTTGVILGPAPKIVPPGQPAPLTREYDALMPGSGIVIWHVDESVAWLDYNRNGVNNFNDNSLQWYNYPSDTIRWENRPFISIEEADGIIDFGGNYYTGFGRPQDLFYASGNDHFGPTTNPSTRSNSKAYTGIDLSDITGIDTLMYFDLRQDLRLAGWPRHSDSSILPPALYDMNGDSIDEIFVSGKHYLLGFKANGGFIYPPPADGEVISERRSVRRDYPNFDTLRAIARIDGNSVITTPPTVADVDADGVGEIAIGTSAGEFYLWKLVDQNADGRADLVKKEKLSNASISASIAVTDADHNNPGMELIIGSIDGGVYIANSQGEILSQTIGFNRIQQFSISPDFEHAYVLDYVREGANQTYFIHDLNDPARFASLPDSVVGFSAGYIDAGDTIWISAVTRSGFMYTFRADAETLHDYFDGNPANLGSVVASEPVLFPGLAEFGRSQLCFGGDNQILVCNLNGTPADNFTQNADIHDSAGEITSSPIIVDVTGDGVPEFLMGTKAGEIFILSASGSRLVNSPLSAPASISTSLAFCPKSGPGGLRGNLYAVTDDGLVYGFSVPTLAASQDHYYYQYGGGSHHRNFQENAIAAPGPFSQLLVDCYNYPNPAQSETNIRFKLTEDARANIRIYDLTGRLVFEDNMQAVGGMANEYAWNLEHYPSGVYNCRLEVTGSGRHDVRLWNIAVVK